MNNALTMLTVNLMNVTFKDSFITEITTQEYNFYNGYLITLIAPIIGCVRI